MWAKRCGQKQKMRCEAQPGPGTCHTASGVLLVNVQPNTFKTYPVIDAPLPPLEPLEEEHDAKRPIEAVIYR